MKRALLLPLVALLIALPLAAQAPSSAIPCGDIVGSKLPDLDEIKGPADSNVLSGTLYTVSEQVRMPAGALGTDPKDLKCYPQYVRAYRKDAPQNWNPPASVIGYPMPGPTLRAKVGDVVNLTFLNVIDANKFPDSDHGCDKTQVYPGTTGDQLPNCFAESVFTNVHYHGTHTSPNSTADNVFLTIRPSPRDPANKNAPIIQASSVKADFDNFFKQCNQELLPATTPKMWPLDWKKDLKPELKELLMGNVKKYGMEGWYAENLDKIEKGYWPQYFVGAYPYCFNLPRYTGQAPGTPDALLMGQSPGTHWYHAHKHGSTTSNVMNGMTGMFIIEGDYDKTIRDYYGANFKEKELVIQQLGSVPTMVTGTANLGANFEVNGRYQPVLEMAGNSVMMWRIANTAFSAGVFFQSPAPGGPQWKQIGIDGVQLSPHNYWTRPDNFVLMSGNRIDLLVKAPAFKPGGNNDYKVIVYNTFDPTDRPPLKPTAPQLTLLTLRVTANGPSMDFIPESQAPVLPKYLRDITDGDVNGKPYTLRFQTRKEGTNTASSQLINDKLFNGTVGAAGELDHAAEWTITNEATGVSHPFHIHINPFQLTEIFSPTAYINQGPIKTRSGELPQFATASTTSGSPDVTGGLLSNFTAWFRAGDIIDITGGQGGTIKTITDDSHMTLTQNATATVKDAIFQRLIPQYTIDNNTIRPGQCYLDPDKPETWKPCKEVEPEAEQRVWWDVFPIPSSKTFTSGTRSVAIPGYFKMRTRFADFSGYFVVHCHILDHEDRGMMTVIEVTPSGAPKQSPYSHH